LFNFSNISFLEFFFFFFFVILIIVSLIYD
jgi:hypothetical protein